MKVEQHDFGTALAPDSLETVGLGPCIGVGIIYRNRGFALHSPDLIVERDHVTDPFFLLLDRYIAQSERYTIRPVVAGGALEVYTENEDDDELRDATRLCRREILRRLAAVGFGSPHTRWARPDQIHSLHLDLEKEVIELETDSILCPDEPPQIERFR